MPSILLISEAPPPASGWVDPEGRAFELERVGSVTEGVERLAGTAFDAVVLGVEAAAEGEAELPLLRERLGHAALLLLAEEYTPRIPELMTRLGGAACLLPIVGDPGAQAPLIALAAERAQLAASLERRVEELEQRTRELEQSRLRFRDIIERNADAIVVIDPDGVIRFGNGVACELFRTTREALPGTPFGFPVVAGETTELDLLRPGSPRVVEMRVVESEWEGRPASIASLRDITERKRTEENARRLIQEQAARAAAEAAARRFRVQAEASTLLSLPLEYTETLSTLARLCVEQHADWAVVYVTDEQGALQRLEVAHRDPARAEAARALRAQPIAERPGHPVLEAMRTRRTLLRNDIDEEVLRGLAQDDAHLDLLRRLGLRGMMIVPLVARERVLGAIGLFSSDPARRFTDEDLVEANDLALRAGLALDNVRLYREARDANQAKTDLLAVISHDLRTPLNSIMGHAQLLGMGIPDRLSDASLEHIDRIRTSTAHLVYLIDELLAYARLEAGHEEPRLQEADAAAIAREVAAVVEGLARERGLEFTLALERESVPLRTDPDRLRQVLLNLAGNAVKYTPQGCVRLEVDASAAEEVVFRVCDTGVGIRPEHLAKIFEPFWQVDSGQRAGSDGTGLGLSVVQRVVEMLGGRVEVESEVGVGSRFTVRVGR